MRSLALTVAISLSGCAGGNAYLNTYRAGVITKEVVTTAHEEVWSEPLREKAAVCDQAVPEDGTTSELDECMDPFTRDNNDKVVEGLAAYQTAAAALTAILIAAEKNPDGVDKEALKAAVLTALDAARELISLFPEAQVWGDRLDMLLSGLL